MDENIEATIEISTELSEQVQRMADEAGVTFNEMFMDLVMRGLAIEASEAQ